MHIAIVDDHPLTCQGLAALLGQALAGEPGPHRIDTLHTAAAARQVLAAASPPPDWLFLDLHLPDDPGLALFHQLCAGPLAGRTVLLSAEVPATLVREAVAAGMRGFLPKSAEPAALLAGFAAMRRGEVTVPDALREALRPTDAGDAAARPLSPRLREVLALVLRGASNKVIARTVGISEHTVKEYMSSILAHHGAANRLELVLRLNGRPPPG